jgi:protein-disulfide isomerase
VRLTEFADALCGHCAQLHELLSGLRRQLPPGSFSIEARHFPLDAACNPQMSGPSKHPVRCTAARVLICAEHQPWAFELAGEIFEHQRELDEARLWELVERHGARAAIESCAFSEVTEARLLDDIAWAVEQGIEGTPLVLIDGRRAPSHPTFLIAMILAGSDPDHPLLRRLPPGHALAP